MTNWHSSIQTGIKILTRLMTNYYSSIETSIKILNTFNDKLPFFYSVQTWIQILNRVSDKLPWNIQAVDLSGPDRCYCNLGFPMHASLGGQVSLQGNFPSIHNWLPVAACATVICNSLSSVSACYWVCLPLVLAPSLYLEIISQKPGTLKTFSPRSIPARHFNLIGSSNIYLQTHCGFK